MKDINNLKKSNACKIQLRIAINSISSKNTNEEHLMHSNNDNIEIMIYDIADEVINRLFESLLARSQIRLEKSMKGSDFVFDCIHLLYYKCHKINLNRGGSHIDFPDWIKNKNATIINTVSDDDKCFQYVANHTKSCRNWKTSINNIKN